MIQCERNIYYDPRLCRRSYRVRITRRGHPDAQGNGTVDLGRFGSMADARAARDKFEEAVPAKPPGSPRRSTPRRNSRDLRRERIAAGMCPHCGEEPTTPGYKSCFLCRLSSRVKSKARYDALKGAKC